MRQNAKTFPTVNQAITTLTDLICLAQGKV